VSSTESIAGQFQIDMEEVKSRVRLIVKKYQPEKILLFGSYAHGTPNLDSDADLLVIMDTKQSTLDLAAEISMSFKHTFPVDIIVRTPQEIAKRIAHGDFFIQDIMENGKVLYEGAL